MFSTFLLKQVDSVFLAERLVYFYVIFLIKLILLLLNYY